MKIRTMLVIASAMLATAAVPVMAQQQSTGERVLRSVLEGLLGPEEEAQEEEVVVPEVEDEVLLSPMEQALTHPRRDADRARDRYRHPAETLEFFRVEPGMTVADYMPATGWYARVLIPYLGEEGTYIGVDPWLDERYTGYWGMYRNTPERLPAEARDWVGSEGAEVIGVTTTDVPAGLAGKVDRFLIFREVHNMRRFGWLHDSLMAARTLLRDDGLIGVVQHRARENAPLDYTFGDNGYQRTEDVVALFELYGFELVASSEINANRNDPGDWEDGVWMLPPNYRGAATRSERARRAAIGESDRMTLLFRKRD